jgi:hypothetical protein
MEKLEQSGMFAGPRQLINRAQAALNGAALRISGKLLCAAPRDPVTYGRIFDDFSARFIQHLSDADLDSLEAELRRMGPVDDKALEAAKRKAVGQPTVRVPEVESEAFAGW